jgi:hypothetical protein
LFFRQFPDEIAETQSATAEDSLAAYRRNFINLKAYGRPSRKLPPNPGCSPPKADGVFTACRRNRENEFCLRRKSVVDKREGESMLSEMMMLLR